MKATARSERRVPVARDRYRAVARHTGVRSRLSRPIAVLDGAILVLAGVFLIFLAGPWVGGAVGTGVDDVRLQFTALFPSLPGSRSIELPSGGGTVTADPVAKGLPDFTRDPDLTLAGQIPTFALAPGRTVQVALNGATVASLTPDSAGLFTSPLTLREGPNAIALTLLAGTDIVARSSYIVVLDRQPPGLLVTTPANGDAVEGPTVTVKGTVEAGATMTVNDRTVLTAQDGSFSDTFNASPGQLTITVVARDRAGNETVSKTSITVKAPTAPTAAVAVGVALDKTRVAPGAWVIAEVRVSANGVARSGELVTLQVGVITIGSATTDTNGVAHIGFAAPPNEGDATVVVLANGATGRATLTVAR